MPSVFVVQHLHVLPEGEEDSKFIGVYSSHENARRAVERMRLAPGFRNFPSLVADLGEGPGDGSGFYVNEHRLDSDDWASGFETV
jgi:hypothetical protein